MSFKIFLVIAGVIGLFSIWAWYFSHDARVKRALAAAPIRTVAELKPGEDARVTGRILTLDPITAPLSGRTCVYYHAKIEEYRSSGKSGRWVTVAEEELGCRFVVADDTGEVHVDPFGAKVAVVKDEHETSGTFDDPSAEELAFLERHSLSSTALMGMANRKLRYTVGVFEIGEQITVLGRVVSREQKLALEAPPDGALYMSDDPSVAG